jgi:hypothetical protein
MLTKLLHITDDYLYEQSCDSWRMEEGAEKAPTRILVNEKNGLLG